MSKISGTWQGFKELEKYRDLREIDRLINNFHDFWETDWDKPYGLGGDFDLKRIIIARLAGNKRWEEVYRKQVEILNNNFKKNMTRKDFSDKLKNRLVHNHEEIYIPSLHFLHGLLKTTTPLYPEYDPNEKKGILSRLGFKK